MNSAKRIRGEDEELESSYMYIRIVNEVQCLINPRIFMALNYIKGGKI